MVNLFYIILNCVMFHGGQSNLRSLDTGQDIGYPVWCNDTVDKDSEDLGSNPCLVIQ